mgnify:CR=1 FL=1
MGKCSVVISRIYAIIILILFSIIAVFYISVRPSMFVSMSPYEVPTESKKIDTTWEEFL